MMSLRNSYDEIQYSPVISGMSCYLLKFPVADPHVKLRLFCFPFGRAGASFYRDWQPVLPKNIEVCPVQTQTQDREERLSKKPFTNLAPLVAEISEMLSPYLEPFAFSGHSVGALISFELAQYLRRLNQPMPSYLFISGRPAPPYP
jgi:medium-chain acyl-[acyl-carrier-protein] hydrolase